MVDVADGPAPSITSFRSELRSILSAGPPSRSRDVVVFAIDGVPHRIAAAIWRRAAIKRLQSVFPTTSSVGWLSSLTGEDVDAHGVPGVVFRDPKGGSGLVEVFSYKGPLCGPMNGNVFSDAARLGYQPISLLGDLQSYDCSWRDSLLQHSQPLSGRRIYTVDRPLQPEEICRSLRDVIDPLLTAPSECARLVWCFVDLDQHVHRSGYDEHVSLLLECFEGLALELIARDAIVLAHSDHGLVRTENDPTISQLFETLESDFDCAVGGAGRARWIYAPSSSTKVVREELVSALPASSRVCSPAEFFAAGSLAHSRVGEIMVLAEGDEFVTSPGYVYDHGSLADDEIYVPLACWGRDVDLDS